jgi:hypothetical protein
VTLASLFPRNSLLTWICAFSSLALLLTIVTLAIHIRLELGHWPTPMTETYDSIALRMHEWVVFGAAHFALFMAIPLWPLLLFFKRFRAGVRTHMVQSAVYSAGWLMIYLFFKFDPTSFGKWFTDRI